MKNSCNVMQDLFVPYLDNTCSDESRALLEQHLEECEACRKTMETYQSSVPSVDIQANVVSKKPFIRIHRRMKLFIIVIVVLLILILPVAVYQIYGRTHNFYEADKLFLGLDNSDFINASRLNDLEARTCSMYRTMYYTLQIRNGTVDSKATLSELVEESNSLDQVVCDYENAEIVYDEDFNTIIVTIPLLLPDDDTPTVVQLAGSRVGCGKYSFSEITLYPRNMLEEKYVALDYANAIFDSLDAWPFTGRFTCMVESWKKYDLPVTAPDKPRDYCDTDVKIPSGVYMYMHDDGKEDTLTIYEDGTLMYEFSREKIDTNWFPYEYPSVLEYVYCTANPCPYFIIEGDNGFELVIRYEKTGIRNTRTIEFLKDGSLYWRNQIFTRIGDTK